MVGIAAAGWVLFGYIPAQSAISTVEILLIAGLGAIGLSRVRQRVDDYYDRPNSTELSVHGEIEKGGGEFVVSTGSSVSAAAVTDGIETAEQTDSVETLLIDVDSAGGGLLPSIQIAREVAAFDGTTVASVTGDCASGAYLVAAACDKIYARENALVGSIGVRGSRYDLSELGQKLGVEYESFVTGEYKDAGAPIKEISDDDREYFQSIVDQGFDNMVTSSPSSVT